MNGPECYAVWAPEGVVWSPWAKPVLFAQMDALGLSPAGITAPAVDPIGLPEARSGVAVIVDVAGVESVRVGLALAQRGFRPVPLYNATVGPSPAVNVRPIVEDLLAGTDALREARLAPDAPPAFLLDAGRRGGVLRPGRYDNRWIVLPQDFPSATLLRSRGIGEVVVVKRGKNGPAQDLAHVLRRWQDTGIRIVAITLNGDRTPRPLEIRPPSRFRRAWYVAIALLGLRRSNVGGFGGFVPEETSGGGFG